MDKFTKKWPEYNPNETYHSISKKLLTEEELENNAQDAITFLGKPGRMLETSPFVMHNAVIKIPRQGEIWYGDIDLYEDVEALTALSKAIEDMIMVIDEEHKFVESYLQLAMSNFVAAGGKVVKSRFTDVY